MHTMMFFKTAWSFLASVLIISNTHKNKDTYLESSPWLGRFHIFCESRPRLICDHPKESVGEKKMKMLFEA